MASLHHQSAIAIWSSTGLSADLEPPRSRQRKLGLIASAQKNTDGSMMWRKDFDAQWLVLCTFHEVETEELGEVWTGAGIVL